MWCMWRDLMWCIWDDIMYMLHDVCGVMYVLQYGVCDVWCIMYVCDVYDACDVIRREAMWKLWYDVWCDAMWRNVSYRRWCSVCDMMYVVWCMWCGMMHVMWYDGTRCDVIIMIWCMWCSVMWCDVMHVSRCDLTWWCVMWDVYAYLLRY